MGRAHVRIKGQNLNQLTMTILVYHTNKLQLATCRKCRRKLYANVRNRPTDPRLAKKLCVSVLLIFFSILLTHEGSHREAYRDFQPSLTSSAGGAKRCSDHRFRAPPAYTAQLPTLHQHRANNQYRTYVTF